MKRVLVVCSILVILFTFCSVSQAAVYRLEDQPLVKKQAADGKGELLSKFAFSRDNALPQQAIKEMKYLVLLPGDSIGVHEHKNNEDCYLICSGKGLYIETDGSEHIVTTGDMTICRAGQSHGLVNIGEVPLVFFAVLGQR